TERLDGLDAAAVGLHRKHAAGAGREPIEQDGAGAAHAVFAADMRAGQADLVADEVREQQPWLDSPLVRSAVDRHVDLQRVHLRRLTYPPSSAVDGMAGAFA